MKEFTKSDKASRTILLPQMLEYHSALIKAAFEASGYKFDIMHSQEPPKAEALRYISSDYCYPSFLIIGQVLEALHKYSDSEDKIAFMEPQAGGACRCGNIYNLIIDVLDKLGYGDIPVISLNFRGNEKHSGFKITPKLVINAASAVCIGDLIMLLYQQTKPYEKSPGAADSVMKKCRHYAAEFIKKGGMSRRELYPAIVREFSRIERLDVNKRKVGVAGEIYIKYSSLGNHGLEKFLLRHGAQVYFGGFANYLIYVADSEKQAFLLEHNNKAAAKAFDTVIEIMEKLQREMFKAVRENSSFFTDLTFTELRKKADGIISHDCITGDGWLVAAEVVQAIERGCESVLIVHPFGCLVSHICERGVMSRLRAAYPGINIQTIEYDYDQSPALRESRILLGISDIRKRDKNGISSEKN